MQTGAERWTLIEDEENLVWTMAGAWDPAEQGAGEALGAEKRTRSRDGGRRTPDEETRRRPTNRDGDRRTARTRSCNGDRRTPDDEARRRLTNRGDSR
jgi:hypothetical protein